MSVARAMTASSASAASATRTTTATMSSVPPPAPSTAQRGAAREGDDAGEAQRSIRGQVGLGDQETCADAQQHDAQEDHGSQAIVAPRDRGIAGPAA